MLAPTQPARSASAHTVMMTHQARSRALRLTTVARVASGVPGASARRPKTNPTTDATDKKPNTPADEPERLWIKICET